MPITCRRVGAAPKARTAKATVNSAWLCTMTLASPTGTPCAMPNACARNWPRNSVALMAINSGQDTSGLRTNRHGTAAMAKRSVVISVGGNSSSASRLATKPSPQITATRVARKMSAGLMNTPLHPLRPAADGGDAGARHLDEAERAHQVDELADLGGVAGDLEHEALGRGIDHPRAKRVGQPHRLDPGLAHAAHLHHRLFAFDRAAAGQRH